LLQGSNKVLQKRINKLAIMKNYDFTKIHFVELPTNELYSVNGGDKFMKDLGNWLGHFFCDGDDAWMISMNQVNLFM
jgi:hypothetical protein